MSSDSTDTPVPIDLIEQIAGVMLTGTGLFAPAPRFWKIGCALRETRFLPILLEMRSPSYQE
ncbi:MAG: hypothetical protein IPI77_16175 [Saprospiraceae bacterium]|nr:hypothetical protein [Saprospiraceae bacterium]